MDREWKFTLGQRSPDEIAALVQPFARELLYDLHRPLSFTRTLYLDTQDFGYLYSRGPLRRRLRLRQYASARSPRNVPRASGDVFLERKQSSGSQRCKLRVPVPPALLAELLASHGSRSFWQRAVMAEPGLRPLARMLTAPVHAVALSWYRRRTFAAPDARVRITLDTDVGFGPPSPAVPPLWLTPGASVVEVKSAGPPPPWLDSLLHCLGAPVAVSKYEQAVAAARSSARLRA